MKDEETLHLLRWGIWSAETATRPLTTSRGFGASPSSESFGNIASLNVSRQPLYAAGPPTLVSLMGSGLSLSKEVQVTSSYKGCSYLSSISRRALDNVLSTIAPYTRHTSATLTMGGVGHCDSL